MSSRERARTFVESRRVQWFITGVILLNAVTLGAETSSWAMDRAGSALTLIDRLCLAIFVIEILVKLYGHGLRFFRDPWNCFDFLVIGISLVPAAGGLSVLRALRILRVLRLISIVPSMRRVVSTLLAAIPGLLSILGLLVLILYVAAVMATKLFKPVSPEYFGNLGTSLWTLFQTMTGEGWPDVARQVMQAEPMSWVFFLVYIVVSTFIVLNLFLAVMVSAAEKVSAEEIEVLREDQKLERETESRILEELRALRQEVGSLRAGFANGSDGHSAAASSSPTSATSSSSSPSTSSSSSSSGSTDHD